MAQATCCICGVEIEYRLGRPRNRCDSDDCRRAYFAAAARKMRAKQRAARPDKKCRECDKPFVPMPQHKAYCSDECGRAAHLRTRRDREYQPPPRVCDFCGAAVPYKSGKRRYCSIECRTAGIAKVARWKVKGVDPSLALVMACALCGATDRKLVIDHDHQCCPAERACGKCFRGMLCHSHNVALGIFGEDPVLLRKAARYIEDARIARLGVEQPALEI